MPPVRPPRVEEAPPASHNLFFALWPPDDIRERIEAAALCLKRDHGPAGRSIRPHRYHLTLRYLGAHAHLPDELVATAGAAGDRVRVAAFEFALDIAGSFAMSRIPWWLGCQETADALNGLWNEITEGLRIEGHSVGNDALHVPHVTILRDADRRLPSTPIAPIAWPVGEFVLIDSLLGPSSHYSILRRWTLPH